MSLERLRLLAGISESSLNEKSKSEKQARFMAAAAHDPKFAKKVGIEQDVAKEFNKADTGTELLSKANKKIDEALPPKAMSALRTAKDKLAKDKVTAPVAREPEVAYTSNTSPEEWLSHVAGRTGKRVAGDTEVPDILSVMNAPEEPKGERYPGMMAKLRTLNTLLPIKKKIETLAKRAERWGPLPRGIESDLDDSHIAPDDYETQLEHAKTLLSRLEQYMSMKKSIYKKTNETAHVDTCRQSNSAAARDACAMEEGRTVPLSKRDANKLFKRSEEARWERVRDNYEREKQQSQQKDQEKKGQVSEVHEYDEEFLEGIELGDNSLGALAHYIVDQRNDKVLAGPFDRYEEATTAADTFQWYDPRVHFIEVGSEDEDGFFVDEEGNRGVMEEDFNNGYGSEKYASGNDFFPNGADGPVVKKVGPSGARQGDNPEQKKMQVEETHRELVYAYREYLKESAKK